MFGIAVWDRRRQRVVIARDRAGIKPFYYQDDSRLLFGSGNVIAATSGCFARDIDYSALDAYFTNCFISTPKTVFKNIHKLLPGHLLIVEKNKFSPKILGARLPDWRANDLHWSITEFRRQFTEAVKLRMIADVPLGAFLSGGIDSSAVVATMSELSDRRWKPSASGSRAKLALWWNRRRARK